ncbi:MAG: LytR/AlgR family response regulator transcription factor [Chitinophagaceae bacterium]
MLTCIAVDDEPLALTLLEDNISKVPFLKLVAKCADAFEAMKVLQEQTIDLVFIDIQMPGLTGLQFIESLTQKPMVILITAYKQFALEGYALNVVDYLVKPVELKRFMAACNKTWELYQLKNAANRPFNQPLDYFFVNADYRLVKIMYNEITWIEGLRDYLKIHLKSSAKPVITRMNLKDIEEQLPASKFLRIHKSFIVGIESITSVRKNSVFINEMELPVGETYRDSIKKITGRSE